MRTMDQSELTKMLLTCKMWRILTGCVCGLRTMPHFSSVAAGARLLSGKKPDKQLRVRTCGHFAMRKEGVCGEPSRPISFFLSLLFLSHRFVNVCSDSVLDLDQTKLLEWFRKKVRNLSLVPEQFSYWSKGFHWMVVRALESICILIQNKACSAEIEI